MSGPGFDPRKLEVWPDLVAALDMLPPARRMTVEMMLSVIGFEAFKAGALSMAGVVARLEKGSVANHDGTKARQ